MRDNQQHINNFKDFYNNHFNRVYHFFKNRINNREDAKDLTHDVFLKVLQNFQKVCSAKNIDAFLFTIARNVLVDYYKKALQKKQIENYLPTTFNSANASAITPVFSEEEFHCLQQSIEALPEQRKEIIKRKKLQGHSTEEIAKELNLSKRTVENQVYRAMLTLRKQMTQFLSLFL